MSIRVIKSDYLIDNIYDLLRDNIYRGDLQCGDVLISEKELAETFHVSRKTVKTAVRMLEKEGYVESRGESGYTVTGDHQESFKNFSLHNMAESQESLDHLLELRNCLECYGVVLAANNAKFHDILFLKEMLSELSENKTYRDKLRGADINFHIGVAFATRNPFYVEILKQFYEYLFSVLNRLKVVIYEYDKNLENIYKQHYKIYDAIISRDAMNAKRYMQQHIVYLRSLARV